TVDKVEVRGQDATSFSIGTGAKCWSYHWTPSALGQVTIKSRAVDNTGNVQDPPAQIHVTVDAPPTSTITSPKEGDTVAVGKPVKIGRASCSERVETEDKDEALEENGATY